MSDTLPYRVGSHATFLAAMRERLSSSSYPGLRGLTTREVGDPSVALLDAWACVADVLTFYTERIANEGYLRTATERRSVLELARLVGYRARPGVAADVYLAYTLDDSAGPVEIPRGSRVNSVPGPGEQLQAFETSEPLAARPEWNRLRVRLTQPQTGSSILHQGLYLRGTATGLRTGDPLLVDLGVGRGLEAFRVGAVEPDDVHERTRVELRTWAGGDPLSALLRATGELADLDRFGIADDSATAARVRPLLRRLADSAETADETHLSRVLGEAVPAVAEELATARRNNWGRLTAWLGEAHTRLSALEELAAPSGTARGARRQDGQESGIGGLLDSLAEPPSVPPPSARRLARSVQTTFAANRDIYPALLGALRPQLAASLYPALGNATATPASQITVYALRTAAALFGATAPQEAQYSDGQFSGFTEWIPRWDERPDRAYLDRNRPEVLAGSRVLVERPPHGDFGATVVTAVQSAATAGRSAYGMTGPTTVLQLEDPWWNPPNDGQEGDEWDQFDVLRGTTMHCQSEQLPLADAPIADDVCGTELELDGLYEGLRSGRWLVISGERVDVPGTTGVRASELLMLSGVSQRVQTVPGLGPQDQPADQPLPGDQLHTFLTIATPLAYCYRRDTVVLNANVVHATNGETREEVLGGGDAAKSLQVFTLKQPPLTYTSAPTTSGTASSLQVRVDGVQWHEAATLTAMGPATRGFLTRQDDSGRTTLVFGNGEHGARLPSGFDNVRATYRSGIGSPGNVRAGQISLLATKPLGVKEVVNPLRASGGADPDDRDQIRRNTPLAVMALDRLVSVPDYADFARTFAGIGKATAVRLTDGTRQLVQVTIAGVDDIPIDPGSDLLRNLAAAMRRYGDPYLPVRVDTRELMALVVAARVRVLPDHDWELVEPQLRARLLDTFGFDGRELAQDALPSELISTMQAVAGVDYVDLDVLTSIDEDTVVRRLGRGTTGDDTVRDKARAAVPDAGPGPEPVLVWPARFDHGTVRTAQLAYLRGDVPDTLILNEVTP